MLTRRSVKPLHRTRLAKTFQPTVPTVAWTASNVTNQLYMTVPAGYVLNGIPGATANGTKATAAAAHNSTVIALTYAANVTTGTNIVLGANDPGVRYPNGAYLSALTVTL